MFKYFSQFLHGFLHKKVTLDNNCGSSTDTYLHFTREKSCEMFKRMIGDYCDRIDSHEMTTNGNHNRKIN